MKKTININFQGQLVTIEETAYHQLNQYIQGLKDYFRHEQDGSEIVNDIENRIAELFGNRLKHGISCITDEDVTSIINTIGRPEEFDTEFDETDRREQVPPFTTNPGSQLPPPPVIEERRSLYRNTNDKILGGVASGVAHYFKIDPIFIRLLFVVLASLLFWVYIILWIVLPAKNLPSNVTKRIYRNPNDKFIAGVCGGFAAHFKIDTWIPRVVFLLPLLFNILGVARLPFLAFNKMFFNFDWGWGWNINFTFAAIYVVLWIIMPKAVTVKQKLEMMGEDEYLKSIRATVSDNVQNVKKRTDDNSLANAEQADIVNSEGEPTNNDDSNNHNMNSYVASPPPPPVNPAYRTSSSLQSERSGCLNALIVLLKIVFFTIAGIVAASLMITLFALIFTGTQFIPLESLFINKGFEHNLLWASIILSLGVPTVGVIIWIVRRMMKAKSRPIIGYTVAALWLIGIVAGLTLGYRITEKFSTEGLQEYSIVLNKPSINKLYVEMDRYSDDYYSVTPSFSDFDLDNLPFFNADEDSLLYNTIQLKMKVSKDSLYHVKTIFASYGKNNKTAKANIKDFSFRLQQNDSVLLIPQFFSVPKAQGFRNQMVVVEIFVPNGTKIEVSEDLKDYQRTITSKAIRRKYGNDNNYENNLNWNSDEEYVLDKETLTETKLLQDSI
ncbi:MAG: PspC domain-containing protein [Candidatus Saccharimonadaceae bacterium]